MSLKRKKGFTLIELLVVIAIIGVLAGLLMGAISNVRKKSASTQCQANLKQIATACILYEQDKGAYPGASDISSLISMLNPDYLDNNNVFECPRVKGLASYEYNTPLFGMGGGRSVDMVRGTSAVLIKDSEDDRHISGCNLAFADGHVEYMKSNKVSGWQTWGNTL